MEFTIAGKCFLSRSGLLLAGEGPMHFACTIFRFPLRQQVRIRESRLPQLQILSPHSPKERKLSRGGLFMPELRQNFMTKEWVVIATERAKRPDQMVIHRQTKTPVSFSEKCPFCPGNEKMTPPEILRLHDGDGWRARVVPNKFAALSPDSQPDRTIHRSLRSMGGFGHHDVIVETPDHSLPMALMPDSQVADILRIYKTRYDHLSLDPRIAQVTIFKNHGADAGTSLEHPHSQMIATPVISYQVRQRFQEALRHYDDFGCCIFCQMIEEELQEKRRIVLESEHFVAAELFASPAPFFTHIYPRRHMASFGDRK